MPSDIVNRKIIIALEGRLPDHVVQVSNFHLIWLVLYAWILYFLVAVVAGILLRLTPRYYKNHNINVQQ
jgi:hypothetical protein